MHGSLSFRTLQTRPSQTVRLPLTMAAGTNTKESRSKIRGVYPETAQQRPYQTLLVSSSASTTACWPPKHKIYATGTTCWNWMLGWRNIARFYSSRDRTLEQEVVHMWPLYYSKRISLLPSAASTLWSRPKKLCSSGYWIQIVAIYS